MDDFFDIPAVMSWPIIESNDIPPGDVLIIGQPVPGQPNYRTPAILVRSTWDIELPMFRKEIRDKHRSWWRRNYPELFRPEVEDALANRG